MRLRRLGSLAAVALLALVTGCATPTASLRQPEEWTRILPAKYGTPLDARVADGTVLVTTTLGLIGMDPVTGAEKWWRDMRDDFVDRISGDMSRGVAMFQVTIAGDAIVVNKAIENTPGGTGRAGREVLDLATGQTRFTVLPKTDIENGWFFVHVTPSTIVSFDCPDLVDCDITSLPLNGGAPLWTINVPGGRADLPEQLSWSQERGHSSDGLAVARWVVAEDAGIAVINDDKKNVSRSLDLATGQILGEWEQAETRAWYMILGPTVIEVGAGQEIRGLDPANGQERWKHSPLAGASTPFGYNGHLMHEGLLIDETESSSGVKKYQFVDLLTGPQEQPAMAPRQSALVITPTLVVTVNEMLSEVTGTDPVSGEDLWTAALDNAEGSFRLAESAWSDGELVVNASPGFDEPGMLHAVDTATGRLRSWVGQSYLGGGEGLFIAYSGDATEGFALHSHWR